MWRLNESDSPILRNYSIIFYLIPLPYILLPVLKNIYFKNIYKFYDFLVAYLDKPHWDWVLSKAIKVNTNNTALILCYQSLALWWRLSTRVSTSRGGHLSTGTERAEVTDKSHSALQTDVWVTTLSHCKPGLEPNQVGSAVSPFFSSWPAHSFPKTIITDHTLKNH